MIKTSTQTLLGAFACLFLLQQPANGQVLGYRDPNKFASANICQMSSDDFITKSLHPSNLTSQENEYGPLHTGLCWWHSRMQRASIYLAVFDRPSEAPPTPQEASQIFATIAQLQAVVHIPGFRDWDSFTTAYKNEFYSYLGRWEITDTLEFQFFRGIRPDSSHNQKALQQIQITVNNFKRIPFLMLKRPGVLTHAWLINGMQRVADSRYKMSLIDSEISDHPALYDTDQNTFQYVNEDDGKEAGVPEALRPLMATSSFPEVDGLSSIAGEPITLYMQHDDDYQKINKAILHECGRETPFTSFQEQVEKSEGHTTLSQMLKDLAKE